MDFAPLPRRAPRARRLLSTALLAALPAAATAQEAEPATLPAVEVKAEAAQPYIVKETGAATRLPLSLRETPQSVTVFTRQRLEDQNLQSMRDVLDNTSGIYSYAYDTERVVFTARGFVVDNLLYDNIPASTVFSTGSIDETIDTAMYERIEIVRGATGLLSGAGPSRTLIFESDAAGATVLGTVPNGSSFLEELLACVLGPEAAAAPALPTTFSFSETTRTLGSSSEVTEMVKLPSMPASCGAANATYGRPPLRGGSTSESERRSLVERLVFSTMPTKSVMRPSNFSPFITHAPKRNLASRSCRANSIWYVAFSTLG